MSKSFSSRPRPKSASVRKKTRTSKKRFVAKRASALAKKSRADFLVRHGIRGRPECLPHQRILTAEHNHDVTRKNSGIRQSGARPVLLGLGHRHRYEPGRLAG